MDSKQELTSAAKGKSESTEGAAIPFITVKGGEFSVTPEATQFLKSLKSTKLGILAIAGKYRTGKSYLLNKIILQRCNTVGGFKVGPTVNPCTKGLWMWNQTIKGQSADGEDMDMVVIDCEGFGGMDESQDHDSKIMILALLLASHFVYNSTGTIDENALTNLSTYVNMAKKLRLKDDSKEEDGLDESVLEQFPQFLWVVRDFSLRMVNDHGEPVTSKQYLESALTQVKGNTDAAETKNKIRRTLNYFFRNRDCVTMVRPAEVEADLQNLDNLPDKYIREEFLQQAELIRKKVLKKVKPKMFNGSTVDSEALLFLANRYAESINQGKLPSIDGAWNYVMKEKAQELSRECVSKVEELYQKDPEIQQIVQQDGDWRTAIRTKLVSAYKQKNLVVEKGESEAQITALEKKLEDKFDQISKTLAASNQQIAEKFLEDAFVSTSDLMKQNLLKTQEQVKEAFDEIERNFNAAFDKKIPPKQREALMVRFKGQKEGKVLDAVLKVQEEERLKEQAQQQAMLEAFEKEIKQKEMVFEEESHKMRVHARELEEALSTCKGSEASLRERVTQLQERIEVDRKHAAEREEAMKKTYEDNSSRLAKELETISQKLLDKERDLFQANAEKEKFDAMLQQQKTLGTQTIESLKSRIAENESVLSAYKTREEEMKVQIKELMRNEEAKELREQLDSANSRRKLLESELNDSKKEKLFLESQVNFYQKQLENKEKVHDTLLLALQHQPKADDDIASQLIATNKNLGNSLAKAEVRIKALESKVERYRLYKQMVAGAKAFTCKETGKLVSKNAFLAHLQNLALTKPSGVSPFVQNQENSENEETASAMNAKSSGVPAYSSAPFENSVKIAQTKVSQDKITGKSFTEYMMQVRFEGYYWNTTRSYREFTELNHALVQAYPNLRLPSSGNQILGFGGQVSTLTSKKTSIMENRREALEEYLNELLRTPQVVSSPILREFLKIDLYTEPVDAHLDNGQDMPDNRSAHIVTSQKMVGSASQLPTANPAKSSKYIGAGADNESVYSGHKVHSTAAYGSFVDGGRRPPLKETFSNMNLGNRAMH